MTECFPPFPAHFVSYYRDKENPLIIPSLEVTVIKIHYKIFLLCIGLWIYKPSLALYISVYIYIFNMSLRIVIKKWEIGDKPKGIVYEEEHIIFFQKMMMNKTLFHLTICYDYLLCHYRHVVIKSMAAGARPLEFKSHLPQFMLQS